MIQRIALLIGGLGAAGVLAVALGFGNFIFAAPATNLAAADNQPVAAADTNVAAAPNNGTGNNAGDQNVQPQTKTKTVIDKVYIAPTPAPKTVHVTPKTPKSPNTQPSNPTTTTPAAPPAPATTPSYHEGNDHEGRNAEHDRGEPGND